MYKTSAARSLLRQTSFFILGSLLLLVAPIDSQTTHPTTDHSHLATLQQQTSEGWPELMQGMETMHHAMGTVQSSGNNDVDFVRLMLPHHQAALDMAKTELKLGSDPQLRRLAQEIIADQQSEIELMNLWLKQHEGNSR